MWWTAWWAIPTVVDSMVVKLVHKLGFVRADHTCSATNLDELEGRV